jgi:DNA-3-methyladenine glycosylase II
MDALLTHGTEQEADEASMPTRSYYQQVAGGSNAKESLCGGALYDLAVDLDGQQQPTMNWRAPERRRLQPLSDSVPAQEAMPGPLRTRMVASGRHKLSAAEARWENEGGAEDGQDPSDLRRRTISIKPPPPFRLDLSAWALRRRPGNAMDVWDGNSYRRALAFIDGEEVELCVTQDGGAETPRLIIALVESRLGRCGEQTAVTALERLLGLRVDLSDFYLMAAADSVIGPIVARFRGVKPPRFPTVFESLLNAVANQQLSLEAGLSLLNRLAATHGRSVTDPNSLHAFPRPQDLAELEPQGLCDLGFSRRKAMTIVEISRAVVAGRLDLESLDSLADDEVVSQLTSLNGIGRWSAEYVLLRGLGRLHVFPGDDVGARNNLAHWLALKPPLDYAAVGKAVARWQPYAGMVYFHLLLARLEEAGQIDHELAAPG